MGHCRGAGGGHVPPPTFGGMQRKKVKVSWRLVCMGETLADSGGGAQGARAPPFEIPKRVFKEGQRGRTPPAPPFEIPNRVFKRDRRCAPPPFHKSWIRPWERSNRRVAPPPHTHTHRNNIRPTVSISVCTESVNHQKEYVPNINCPTTLIWGTKHTQPPPPHTHTLFHWGTCPPAPPPVSLGDMTPCPPPFPIRHR